MKVILKLTTLCLVSSLAANSFAGEKSRIPSVPTAIEINSAVTPQEMKCNPLPLSVSEDDLKECYTTHPFFLEALMLITDVDFSDRHKSLKRKKILRNEISKNKQSVGNCLSKIIQYAEEKTDVANQKYVQKRMSEISSIIQETN